MYKVSFPFGSLLKKIFCQFFILLTLLTHFCAFFFSTFNSTTIYDSHLPMTILLVLQCHQVIWRKLYQLKAHHERSAWTFGTEQYGQYFQEWWAYRGPLYYLSPYTTYLQQVTKTSTGHSSISRHLSGNLLCHFVVS